MTKQDQITITFAGLTVRFIFPNPVKVPDVFRHFLSEASGIPDITYRIELLDRPLSLDGLPLTAVPGSRIYTYEKGWLRIYPELIAEDGCQVALSMCLNKDITLYYPSSRWSYYSEDLHLLHLLGIEQPLLFYDSFLLHSSLVRLHGQTVLFTGPSGIGKSTQAALWEKYLQADILNGDRCILRKTGDQFYGCGSPWAGTSGIYHSEMAPVRGIFILKQAATNEIRQIPARIAFSQLFSQSIVNTWNSDFIDRLSSLIGELMKQVPVYELSCRPDEEAVRLAYHTLWKEADPYEA